MNLDNYRTFYREMYEEDFSEAELDRMIKHLHIKTFQNSLDRELTYIDTELFPDSCKMLRGGTVPDVKVCEFIRQYFGLNPYTYAIEHRKVAKQWNLTSYSLQEKIRKCLNYIKRGRTSELKRLLSRAHKKESLILGKKLSPYEPHYFMLNLNEHNPNGPAIVVEAEMEMDIDDLLIRVKQKYYSNTFPFEDFFEKCSPQMNSLRYVMTSREDYQTITRRHLTWYGKIYNLGDRSQQLERTRSCSTPKEVWVTYIRFL